MPIINVEDAVAYEVHGSRFTSYVAPSRGSRQLAAWRLDVPAETTGVPHRPSREEVMLVLAGRPRITLDGVEQAAQPGQAILVPAGSEFSLSTGPEGASAWVTTTPGLAATMADGSRFTPPWAS